MKRSVCQTGVLKCLLKWHMRCFIYWTVDWNQMSYDHRSNECIHFSHYVYNKLGKIIGMADLWTRLMSSDKYLGRLQWNNWHENFNIWWYPCAIRSSKATCQLYLLSQLKRAGTSPDDLLGFYCSLIRSMLESSCQLFHCSLRICLQKFLSFGELVNNSIVVKDSSSCSKRLQIIDCRLYIHIYPLHTNSFALVSLFIM